MTNMRSLIAIAPCVAALLIGTAFGQVKIVLSASSFKAEDKIEAVIVNQGRVPVSYCVEFGQSSPKGAAAESTPVPFHVERRQSEKWSVLLIGPDVGSSRRVVELEAGKSQDFPFRLLDKGNMRLVLHYWLGERDDSCSETAKGKKTAKSQVFSIIGN